MKGSTPKTPYSEMLKFRALERQLSTMTFKVQERADWCAAKLLKIMGIKHPHIHKVEVASPFWFADGVNVDGQWALPEGFPYIKFYVDLGDKVAEIEVTEKSLRFSDEILSSDFTALTAKAWQDWSREFKGKSRLDIEVACGDVCFVSHFARGGAS